MSPESVPAHKLRDLARVLGLEVRAVLEAETFRVGRDLRIDDKRHPAFEAVLVGEAGDLPTRRAGVLGTAILGLIPKHTMLSAARGAAPDVGAFALCGLQRVQALRARWAC